MKRESKRLSDSYSMQSKTTDMTIDLSKYEQCTKEELLNAIEKVSEESISIRNKNKNLISEVQNLKGNIIVAVRVRPILISDGPENSISKVLDDNSISIYNSMIRNNKIYETDHCFDERTSQESLALEFQYLIDSFQSGYNVSIIAYGQTGSGKTYTMFGDDENPGLNYNLMKTIIQNKKNHLKLSMIEIYNEEVIDLLDPKVNRLTLSVQDESVKIVGNKQYDIKDFKEFKNLVEKGFNNRKTSFTDYNMHSSRSHCIIRIDNESSDDDIKIRNNSLLLVDLAGSERISTLGLDASRLQETQYINKSLSSLGMVLASISEKAKFIPFRNSKLTMLLKESFKGSSKTVMICTVCPNEKYSSDTISTLEFAKSCKKVSFGNIQKHYKLINSETEVERLRHTIKELNDEIKRLKNAVEKNEIQIRTVYSGKVEEERQKLKTLNEEKNSIILENSKLKIELKNAYSNYNNLEKENEKIKKEKSQYESTIKEKKSEREELLRTIALLEVKNVEQESQISYFKKQKDELIKKEKKKSKSERKQSLDVSRESRRFRNNEILSNESNSPEKKKEKETQTSEIQKEEQGITKMEAEKKEKKLINRKIEVKKKEDISDEIQERKIKSPELKNRNDERRRKEQKKKAKNEFKEIEKEELIIRNVERRIKREEMKIQKEELKKKNLEIRSRNKPKPKKSHKKKIANVNNEAKVFDNLHFTNKSVVDEEKIEEINVEYIDDEAEIKKDMETTNDDVPENIDNSIEIYQSSKDSSFNEVESNGLIDNQEQTSNLIIAPYLRNESIQAFTNNDEQYNPSVSPPNETGLNLPDLPSGINISSQLLIRSSENTPIKNLRYDEFDSEEILPPPADDTIFSDEEIYQYDSEVDFPDIAVKNGEVNGLFIEQNKNTLVESSEIENNYKKPDNSGTLSPVVLPLNSSVIFKSEKGEITNSLQVEPLIEEEPPSIKRKNTVIFNDDLPINENMT